MTKYRKHIQLSIGILLFWGLSAGWLSLWTVALIGLVSGVVFGKVFCKWMCPMGYVMEMMTSKLSDEEQKVNMYNYYKLGCPISWIQGVTNKFSIFKIKVDKDTCTSCGLCDKSCYITSLDKSKSLYKEGKQTPSEAFNCSKCLVCVDECPTKSITYGIK